MAGSPTFAEARKRRGQGAPDCQASSLAWLAVLGYAAELRHREVRHRAKRGLATALQAMDIVLDEERPAEARLADL